MIRRIHFLSGLAILGVVCNHACGWWYLTNVWGVDPPNFALYDTPAHYALLVIQQLAVFSVPAFLFVSGYFYAYAARGRQPISGWKVVRARMLHLLIPYLIWSVVSFVGQALDGVVHPPIFYLKVLAVGSAEDPYFFVPLLFQFYLLAPLVAPIARTRWRLFLFASALIQLGALSVIYLDFLANVQTPVFDLILRRTSFHYFPRWAFFFALGLASGFHLQRFRGWLSRYRWGLLVATVLLGLMTIVEPEILRRSYGVYAYRGPYIISGSLYSVAFLLCFMAFQKMPIPFPFSKAFHQLSKSTYGIYLLHWQVMRLVATAMREVGPWMTTAPAMFPLLVIFGLGAPLVLMNLVAKSPARRAHRCLFG